MSELISSVLCGLFCLIIPVLGATIVIVLLIINQQRSRKLSAVPPDWPVVPAKVIGASVEETARTHPDDDVFYYPLIEFEYEGAGQRYTARQAVGKPFNLAYIARKTLEHYPAGKQISVAYNPQKMDEARLSNGS